jgi:hypothetical protein
LATNDKDFKIKNGLVVQGATATVDGNDVLTTASDIEDLSNVDTSGVADGNALIYDSASSSWIPGEGGGGGGGSYTVSPTPPSEPSGGDIWFDSVTGNTYIYYSDYDNDQWVQTSGVDMVSPVPSFIVSETAPEGPISGDFWFDNVTGNIYVYYQDDDTAQWVQTAGPNIVAARADTLTISSTAPEQAQQGDIWYDNEEGITYIYYEDEDSSQWIQFAISRNGAPGADGTDGTDGVSVPAGGTAGQVLVKSSSDDYDFEWVDSSTIGTSLGVSLALA